MYCPTTKLMIPCPAQFVCPHKTQMPQIICHGCEEGATQLVRDDRCFGYILLTIMAGLVLVCIVVYQTIIKRRRLRHNGNNPTNNNNNNKDDHRIKRLEGFEKRVFLHHHHRPWEVTKLYRGEDFRSTFGRLLGEITKKALGGYV